MRKPLSLLACLAASALLVSCLPSIFQSQDRTLSPGATTIGIEIPQIHPALSEYLGEGSSAKSLASTEGQSSRAYVGISVAHIEIYAETDTSMQRPLDAWDVSFARKKGSNGSIILGETSTMAETEHQLPDTLPLVGGYYSGIIRVQVLNNTNDEAERLTVEGHCAFSVLQGSDPSDSATNNIVVSCYPVSAVKLPSNGSNMPPVGAYKLRSPYMVWVDGLPAIGSEKWFSFSGSSTGFTELVTESASDSDGMLYLCVYHGNNGIQATDGSLIGIYECETVLPTVAGESYYCAVIEIEFELDASTTTNALFTISCAESSNYGSGYPYGYGPGR